MEKLKCHTPDFTSENIQKLAALFPNCVVEAKDAQGKLSMAIDFDQLRQELATFVVEGPNERYHLNWPGKRNALLAANAPIAKTLRPCREESVNFDSTRNLLIEGDNLDALKLLQETFLGKVKVVCIDPPYNTGNDFLYKDSFTQKTHEYLDKSNQSDDDGKRMVANPETNGRFHSDWLTMIYPRLKLARNLLREDGVIFICIDDNEFANVKRVCDEIFGEENFLASFVRRRRMATGMRDTPISPDHEYVVSFAKNLASVRLFGSARREEDFPLQDRKGRYRSTDLTVGMTKEMRPNQFYKIVNPKTGASFLPSEERVWRFEPSSMAREIENENIIWPDDETSSRMSRPRFKTRFESGESEAKTNPVSTWIERPKPGVSDASILSSGLNQEATKELRTLLGEQTLEYPKPVSLIRGLCAISSTSDDIILDFFAGSGTTGHAVLDLNSRDNCTRRFILVQLPEPTENVRFRTIAEITKERLRRAGESIKRENATTAANLDFGFRVLKIDSSNMSDVYYAPDSIKQSDLIAHADNIKEDRTPEDLLFQVLVDWGVDLALPIAKETIAGKTIFFVDGDALAACFDASISEELVKELAKRKPLRAVFRDSSYGSDSVKINVEQVFKLLSPTTEIKSL